MVVVSSVVEPILNPQRARVKPVRSSKHKAQYLHTLRAELITIARIEAYAALVCYEVG